MSILVNLASPFQRDQEDHVEMASQSLACGAVCHMQLPSAHGSYHILPQFCQPLKSSLVR